MFSFQQKCTKHEKKHESLAYSQMKLTEMISEEVHALDFLYKHLKSTVLNILKGNQENNVWAIKKQIIKRNQTNSEAGKYSNQNEKFTGRFQQLIWEWRRISEIKEW